jgi:hypothetical protein
MSAYAPSIVGVIAFILCAIWAALIANKPPKKPKTTEAPAK